MWMSQRLHIGATAEEFYDCVLEEADGAEEKLLCDWLFYRSGLYLGPWKIRIGDLSLWRRIAPIIAKVLRGVGHKYPDDVWFFYYGKNEIEHPTAKQLRAFLARHEGE